MVSDKVRLMVDFVLLGFGQADRHVICFIETETKPNLNFWTFSYHRLFETFLKISFVLTAKNLEKLFEETAICVIQYFIIPKIGFS